MKPSDCIGWTLEDARKSWQTQFPDVEIRVRETAPPLRPARKDAPRKSKRDATIQTPPKAREKFGDWRVLRSQWLEDGANRSVEIVAAREKVLEEVISEINAS